MPNVRRLCPVAFWLVLATLLMPIAAKAQGQCPNGGPLVNAPVGSICGSKLTLAIQQAGDVSASAFLGIPYARPPVQGLRWHGPQPLASLPQKPYPATQFGNECVQIPFGGTEPAGDEDCLFLNVWAPSDASLGSKYPVMVFIHGGAFVFGTGGAGPAPGASGFPSKESYDMFDGTYLAATHKVIVVTLNYRLGVLGFFSLEEGLTGNNFGLQDQVLALKWVQQNIASFGGDPSKVTIFGQSAGAMSVGLLAVSSEASNLFQAAIMESNPLGLPYKTTVQANAIGKQLSRMMGCEVVKEQAGCMAKKTAAELVAKAGKPLALSLALSGKLALPDFLTWGPAIDGTLLNNRQPVTQGANLPVPLLLGSNSAEGILFEQLTHGLLPYDLQLAALVGIQNVEKVKRVYPCKRLDCSGVTAKVFTDYIFSCANRHFAIQAAGAPNPKPVYVYEFTQTPSTNLLESICACNGQPCHGAELPFVFNTFETKPNLGNTPDEEQLSQTMGGYWTAFGTSQNPNGGGRPEWPLFSRARNSMNLVQPPVAVTDPFGDEAHCDLWESIGYPVPGIHKSLGDIQ